MLRNHEVEEGHRMLLGAADVKSIEARIKSRKVTDERGLYLLVIPQGSKLWRFD